MRIRHFVQNPRRSSFGSDSTDTDSTSKATMSSFFKSRPFTFQKRSSRKLLTEKKSVSFAPMVSVIHVESYKEDMKDDLWYNQNDIQTMKKNNHLLVNQYKAGYFFETSKNTFFGLEQYLFLKEARFRRDCLYNAVLGLQNRWKGRSRPSDAERIAKVYRNVLRKSIASE